MSDLNLTIRNIKNISQCDIELPLEKGLYAFVGENGCGKSTLMLAISLLVKPSSRKSFLSYDIRETSSVDFTVDDVADHWCVIDGELTTASQKGDPCITNNRYHGFYEGSIFYGSRFYDYNLVESFLKKPQFPSLIRPADSFVCETLSYVLHGDKNHYTELYKIKDKKTAINCGFRGIPYFFKSDKNYISQYNMSSGESMLISLIDFINNLTERNKYPPTVPLLFLIDEAELALHPAAIDRLISLFRAC